MYTLSRYVRTPMARRQPTYWQMAEGFFRPWAEMVNSPMRTNVKETDDAYLFEAELPGFESSEIELTLLDGVMTIAAKHTESEEKDSFSNRSVRRSFTVEGVEEDAISAEYKNGVLRVTLPKAKEPDAPAPRKIDVQSA